MDNELFFVRKALAQYDGQGRKAIDLGCGYGRNSLFLAEKGFDVVAVDNDVSCLAKIKKEDQNNRITTINADLNNFEFSEKNDIILCTFVLHYFEKNISKKIISEAIKHLNENGLLIIALIKIRGKLSSEELGECTKELTTIENVQKNIHDDPHPGVEYPHDHDVQFYIGKKNV